MTQPAAGAPSGWTITAQTETQDMPPGATNFVKGMKITFVTGHNVVSSVFVPYAIYDQAHIVAAVSARAAQLDAISGLTSLATS